jgi:quercetin dioxygenase-like cupin family protein
MSGFLIYFGICLSTMAYACTPDSADKTQIVTAETGSHKILPPDEIEWGPAPPAFERGAEVAILEGDPSVEGEVYTLRLRMPADYSIAPHTHPLPERAVVLSGTMYLGHDTEMNKESAERIEKGTYLTIPPEMVHYVISGSEGETILHITSVGPLELNYVNEEDDPRLR